MASRDGSAQPVTEGAASLVWALILATLVGHPVGQCSAPPPARSSQDREWGLSAPM